MISEDVGSATGGCIQERLALQLSEMEGIWISWQCYLSRWMYSGEAGSATYRDGCIQERLAVQLIEVAVVRRSW